MGYGDIVPSTTASKIFSVFVVMLGFGVLSLVAATIATRWIETEERLIEREILRDVHQQMDALHREIVALRQALVAVRELAPLLPLLPLLPMLPLLPLPLLPPLPPLPPLPLPPLPASEPDDGPPPGP